MKLNPKHLALFLAFILASTLNVCGQSFDQQTRDSLLKVVLKSMPESRRAEFQKQYDEGNDVTKDYLLFVFSMPRSSKKELIANLKSNMANIQTLKVEYAKMIPKDYTVEIEFNPADKLLKTPESIDLYISYPAGTKTAHEKEWNLSFGSDTLARMIQPLHWTTATLQKIKSLLDKAKCISIQNGEVTEIGFARSGMGKYSFLLFAKPLSKTQMAGYNNGCMYIFYKDNIVLEYGGGAVGPQCFPDVN